MSNRIQNMPKRLTALSVFITLSLLIGACGREAEKANIEFMEYGQDYRGKPMFARLEHKLPIADTREHREQLARVTPAYLAGLDQEQVDQIYARLTAGPIPDGPYDGSLFFPQGSSGKLRASEIVGGLKGLAVRVKGKKLEILGKILWKGKVFYRDEMVLRNRIEDLAVLAPIVDDVLNVPKIEVDSRDSWLMFPARLYCGQSLLDGRRESLIIDYAFTDEINGYREKPDFLAGRRGFMVRDEIRMIRPGFYLGRAYLNRVFVLNFTLYNSEIAEATRDQWIETGQVPEDCWIGHQRLAGAAAN